ncbi:MAG TPA: glycosyltransferase family 1 protein [Burkholderiaceae bacterium]
MLKIAMGGTSLASPLTGIGHYTNQLVRGLGQEGYQLGLFMGAHWTYYPSADAGGRAGAAAQPGSGAAGAWLYTGLKRLVRRMLPHSREHVRRLQQRAFTRGVEKFKPDLYHEPNFLTWRFDGPTVTTVHDLAWIRHPETHPQERVALMERHFEPAISHANAIIVVSEFVRQELLDVFPSVGQKIHVIRNGVDGSFHPMQAAQTQPVLSRYRLQHGRYLLALGTLEPRKNLIAAINAHGRLPQALRQAYPLCLVGTKGWLHQDLDRQVSAAESAGCLRWLGYVPQQDLPAVVAGATAMLYPSIYEGFGLPPLEAMASGVPVIASTAGAVVEVVGDTGWLCPAHDHDAFAQAMREVIEGGAAGCQAKVAQARQRAAGFRWDDAVRATRRVYASLV